MSVDSRLASIHPLYMAMGRGEVRGFTVPAFNLRGMTEELSAGIFAAAQETKTGAFILEIARSESEYTAQSPVEFVRRVLVGAERVGWKGPIFIQGDHDQLKAIGPGKMAEGEMERITAFIDEQIAAGFYNIDIDASTLVDIQLPTVLAQQKMNGEVTAKLAQHVRQQQPKGIEISIGGEIGHIGDRNSNKEDLANFLIIFRSHYPTNLTGLSKVSVQTGTSHGGRINPDGTFVEMPVDFQVIEELSKQARKMGMAGVVQHGASTLADKLYKEFPRRGAIEIHLSTGWQNMIFDHADFPAELKVKINQWLDKTSVAERVVGENELQFHYKTRKRAWGAFRVDLDNLSQDFKQKIQGEMKERCLRLFTELGVAGTQDIVNKCVGVGKEQFRTLTQAEVKDKRVIVRVDWNVTLGKALHIVDDTRIVRTLPTIKYLLAHGAKQIILLSHLGKPAGTDPHFSLRPVVRYAEKLLGQAIELCPTYEKIVGAKGQVVMLENLRFTAGEETNDPDFAKQLASLGEIYVNEAFGESHREAASIVGIPKLLPAYAGLWFAQEVETITAAVSEPKNPFVVVMGGGKVEDKIKLLEVLSTKADTILLGGKLANEFVAQKRKLKGKAKVIVPTDGKESPYLDIGPKTIKKFVSEIKKARTIVWNGPMGMVEDKQYRKGTEMVFEAIAANTQAYTLVGGGDTLAALHNEELLGQIDHVSTGGGAMLTLIEQGTLVGIETLKE